jgi:hypothetical protein
MPELMSIYRLEDLSVNYWVRGVFTSFPQITIVNEFPKAILGVPTISVVNGKLVEEFFELGNRETGVRTRRWFIDIFAGNISQRDDFAYRILTETSDGINVYDYNEGFPPSASPSLINHLSVVSKSYNPIPVVESLNEKLYYRGQLILITKNDKV